MLQSASKLKRLSRVFEQAITAEVRLTRIREHVFSLSNSLQINVIIRLKVGHDRFLHVRWVPCHRGMARPQVADGGKASRYGG
jgi:hypothetical protein